MNIFKRFLEIFQVLTTNTPTSYSLFHLVFFALFVGLGIVLIIFCRNIDDKKFRLITLIFWIVFVLLETIKQLIWSFDIDGDTIKFDYCWQHFPYQFCSSPIYVLPLIIFLKDCKLRKYACMFIMTFSFIAGVSVMFYPGDVFCKYIFINHQTMIHHGSQTALGLFFYGYFRKDIKIKSFLKALPVFGVMALIALILDEIMPHVITTTFNMWFISRHYPCTLPVLDGIYTKVPYLVFLLAYFLAFGFAAFLVNTISCGILKLTNKKESC